MKAMSVLLLLCMVAVAYCDDFNLTDFVRTDGYYVFSTQLDENEYFYLCLNFSPSGMCEVYITENSESDLEIDWTWLNATKVITGSSSGESYFRSGLQSNYYYEERDKGALYTTKEFILIYDPYNKGPEDTFLISIASISEDKKRMDIFWCSMDEIFTIEYHPYKQSKE